MKVGIAPVNVKSYALTAETLILPHNDHRRYLAILPSAATDVTIDGGTFSITEFFQFEVAPVNEIILNGTAVVLEG